MSREGTARPHMEGKLSHRPLGRGAAQGPDGRRPHGLDAALGELPRRTPLRCSTPGQHRRARRQASQGQAGVVSRRSRAAPTAPRRGDTSWMRRDSPEAAASQRARGTPACPQQPTGEDTRTAAARAFHAARTAFVELGPATPGRTLKAYRPMCSEAAGDAAQLSAVAPAAGSSGAPALQPSRRAEVAGDFTIVNGLLGPPIQIPPGILKRMSGLTELRE